MQSTENGPYTSPRDGVSWDLLLSSISPVRGATRILHGTSLKREAVRAARCSRAAFRLRKSVGVSLRERNPLCAVQMPPISTKFWHA